MDKHLSVVDNAVRGVGYLLRSNYKVYFQVQSFNRGRHYLFTPPVTRGDIPRYYCLFKRAFLQSFNSQFPIFVKSNSDFSGLGESINEEFLDTALLFKVDWLLFVYNGGLVYRVSPKVVKSFCDKHSLFRFQDKVNTYTNSKGVFTIREKTYCFPVRLLERFGDV